MDFEPFITPDGKRFYFNRTKLADKDFKNGIWVMNKANDNWSEPEFFRPGMFLTSSLSGTIYYTDITDPSRDIVSAKYISGKYDSTKAVYGIDSEFADAHPCIAPDESFIIFDSRRPNNSAPWELYVAFKEADGSWGKSYSLASRLGGGYKLQPSLSPDGKYLFYHSNGDIYWIDSKILPAAVPVAQ